MQLWIKYKGLGAQCSTSVNGNLVDLPKQQETQSFNGLVVLTIHLLY